MLRHDTPRHDTPRHDTPRFSAFTRFIYCHNDQEFLQCLQQAYHEFSIGNELDFTSLANAWLMDAKLPDDWRSLQYSAAKNTVRTAQFTQRS